MWVYIKDGSVWCEPLTDKQRHNKNCVFVQTIYNGVQDSLLGYVEKIAEIDIYVLGDKYYFSNETD